MSGTGRPAAGGAPDPATSASTSASASASASGSRSPVGSVPSGAPPATNTYPDFAPEYRSYLFARDATYAATEIVTVASF